MVLIATLANKNALQDLDIFLFSLNLWNNLLTTKIYIFCDTYISQWVKSTYPLLRIETIVVLDKYDGLNRKQMERMKGHPFLTVWCDLMAEKISLLEYIFQNENTTDGIFLMDADICFLGPLPTIPVGTKLALSPHEIRACDTAKFGHYNGGFLWTCDPAVPPAWVKATTTSRYFEQAALEDIAIPYKENNTLYEFPTTTNYGWWRLLQGTEPAATLQNSWGLRTGDLCIEERPLESIHTHWYEATDRATLIFNQFVLRFLRTVAKKNRKMEKLVRHLEQNIAILRRF